MIPACELDHLIVGALTLEQGAAFIKDTLGLKPQAGGRHLAMGTHNMVLKLGERTYLEIMAIDPAGEAPPRPRWFGLDEEDMRARLRDRPRLLTWAARTLDIDNAVKQCPTALGTVHPMARGAYEWRITIPDDGRLVRDGLVPALIQWDCATHPADNLEDRGCALVNIEGWHPAPAGAAAALAALGLERIFTLTQAIDARLSATIRSPRGEFTITS